MAASMESSADGLVAAVQATHQEIRSLLNEVTAGDDRRHSFERLATLLAAHEAAEQEIVHPLAARIEDGERIVTARLAEEREGKETVETLHRMGTTDPRFDALFAKLRAAVLEHAGNEERNEHPILERSLSAEDSRHAAAQFRAAQGVSA